MCLLLISKFAFENELSWIVAFGNELKTETKEFRFSGKSEKSEK